MSERGKEKLGASRGPCRVFSFFELDRLENPQQQPLAGIR